MAKRIMPFWLRVGDADDYHDFEDVDSLAEELAQHIVFAAALPALDFQLGKLQCRGYTGQNYISLYVGDKDANFERGLTAQEEQLLRQALKQLAQEHEQ